MSDQEKARAEEPISSFSAFLESCPPNQIMKISDLITKTTIGVNVVNYVSTPEILLHCPSETCSGSRIFRSSDQIEIISNRYIEVYVRYMCSNCRKTEKIFSLSCKKDNGTQLSGYAFKLGEVPPFGPPTPARLISMIGPDREHFLKGRRCENQGLGIGAFVYYRRVIENQKNRILSEILKVIEMTGDDPDKINVLKDAMVETQFSKAMDMIKDSVPKSILINGNNPLTLLHRALSKGIHNNDDDECLRISKSIRVIMAELAEKIALVLKDEEEIRKAISVLQK